LHTEKKPPLRLLKTVCLTSETLGI
jgi:hypothetical protein